MTRRVERVQDLVKEEVSRLLLFKIKNQSLKTLSITRVKMTPDLKQARIYYSVFDDQADRALIQEYLVKASGFFRREIGRNLELRFVPEVFFEFDNSLEYAQHMDRLLTDLRRTSGEEEDDHSS
ncbi:MAG: 30S ribosome-binding factor RbfA [Deltaproteobacteria bacterium]|nr:30S ribosome-binding factor RbfA [Deltaproteobacteria bacterium]